MRAPMAPRAGAAGMREPLHAEPLPPVATLRRQRTAHTTHRAPRPALPSCRPVAATVGRQMSQQHQKPKPTVGATHACLGEASSARRSPPRSRPCSQQPSTVSTGNSHSASRPALHSRLRARFARRISRSAACRWPSAWMMRWLWAWPCRHSTSWMRVPLRRSAGRPPAPHARRHTPRVPAPAPLAAAAG